MVWREINTLKKQLGERFNGTGWLIVRCEGTEGEAQVSTLGNQVDGSDTEKQGFL